MMRKSPASEGMDRGRAAVGGVAAAVFVLLGIAGSVFGDMTWDGDTDTAFDNDNNWVGGAAPAHDTTTDVAIFSGALTSFQPVLTAARQVKGLRFDSAGWHLFNWATLPEAHELEISGYGVYDNSPYSSATYIDGNATLKITGPTDIRFQGKLHIYSKITGTGGLVLDGLTDSNNQDWLHLYGDNDFTGDVIFNDAVGQKGSYLSVRHNNALGAKSNLVVRVVDQPGYQSSGAARLALQAPATAFASNVAEIIIEGEATWPAVFNQGGGTTVSTKFTLEGGTYQFSDSGSGHRYHNGEIALKAGTTSAIYKGFGRGTWYQGRDSAGNPGGAITGTGRLRVTGYDGNDTTVYMNGNNTYSGGTYVERHGYEQETYVGHDNAWGTGPVELQSDTDTRVAFTLSKSLTMPNDFRGRGKIGTGNYVLTATGAISPGDTGLATRTKAVGTLYVEDLQFGSGTAAGAYYWQYDENTNDLIVCDTLQFGGAGNMLVVDWLGEGPAPIGEYVLMTYGGADPSDAPWSVVSSAGHRGKVWVDAANNRVMVRLARAGLVVIFK